MDDPIANLKNKIEIQYDWFCKNSQLVEDALKKEYRLGSRDAYQWVLDQIDYMINA